MFEQKFYRLITANKKILNDKFLLEPIENLECFRIDVLAVLLEILQLND